MHTYWALFIFKGYWIIGVVILMMTQPLLARLYHLFHQRFIRPRSDIQHSGQISRTSSTEEYTEHLNSTFHRLAAERQQEQAIAEIEALAEAERMQAIREAQRIEALVEWDRLNPPVETTVRQEREMPRRAQVSNVVTATSTTVHTPTAAELIMIEGASAFFISKLLGTINRNRTRETAFREHFESQVLLYQQLIQPLISGTDGEFRNNVSEMRQAGTNLGNIIQQFDNYLERSFQESVFVQGAAYLNEEFVKNAIQSLCSSYLGFHWDNSTKKLSVHTDSITLSHIVNGTNFTVPLGRFKIVWNANNFNSTNGSPTQFQVFSLDEGFHARNNPRVIHPHVSGNSMCPGDAATGVQASLPAAMNGGRISDAFDLIDGLLHNYGPYPYVHLEQWGNHLCPGCRDSIQIGDMVQCFQCNAGHCRACSTFCAECDRWFCKERCGTLDRETRTYSCPCISNTIRCNGCQQRFDPATPLGNMDPVNGYCPHCLYLWTTGVTPTATTRPTGQAAPATRILTPVPERVPAPPRGTRIPIPVPDRISQVVPVPAIQRIIGRTHRVEFENNYDDLLSSEALLLQERLASTPSIPPGPVENIRQLASALDMLRDIDGETLSVSTVEASGPSEEVVDMLSSTSGFLHPATEPVSFFGQRTADLIRDIGAEMNAVLARDFDNAELSVSDVVSNVIEAVSTMALSQAPVETVVPSNPNRYRDEVTGRWVLR